MSEGQSDAPFDAVGFVKLWRNHGNIVALDRRSDGHMSLYIRPGATGLNIPPASEQEHFCDASGKVDPRWQQAVIDLLLAEEALLK
jgi:hypothetical protein